MDLIRYLLGSLSSLQEVYKIGSLFSIPQIERPTRNSGVSWIRPDSSPVRSVPFHFGITMIGDLSIYGNPQREMAA